MSTATDTRSGFQAPKVAAPKTIKGRKTGRGYVAFTVAFVALMGLVVAGLVFFARGGGLYLALAKPVSFGVAIQPADLVEVRLGSTADLAPISASDKDSVIGKYPTMPLAAGTLITKAQISAKSIDDGKQVVSVTLKAEQTPAIPLTVGAPVLLVRTPDSLASAQAPTSPLSPVAGTVRGVRGLDYGAGNVVDVMVNADDAPAVAIAAATGHVTIVQAAGQGR